MEEDIRVFWVPVLLSLILSRARYLSCSDRNLALVGWAGKMNQVGMDNATALRHQYSTTPMFAVISHCTTDDKDELVWIDTGLGMTEAVSQQTAQDGSETIGRVPYADHQLKVIKQLVLTHLFLKGCSRLVHHMDTMTTDR